MTDEQIKDLWLRVTGFDADGDAADIIGFARALLADGGKAVGVVLTNEQGEKYGALLDSNIPERTKLYTAPQSESAPREAQPMIDAKRMTEIARKWMRPDSESAPEFYWGDFYDCVREIIAAPTPERTDADTAVAKQSALTKSQRIAIQAALSISDDIDKQCHDGSFLNDESVQALEELLATSKGPERADAHPIASADDARDAETAYNDGFGKGREIGYREGVATSNRDDDELHKFLDLAAGEGYVFDGVDAGDLYQRLFPNAFAAAIAANRASEEGGSK